MTTGRINQVTITGGTDAMSLHEYRPAPGGDGPTFVNGISHRPSCKASHTKHQRSGEPRVRPVASRSGKVDAEKVDTKTQNQRLAPQAKQCNPLVRPVCHCQKKKTSPPAAVESQDCRAVRAMPLPGTQLNRTQHPNHKLGRTPSQRFRYRENTHFRQASPSLHPTE